MRPDFSQWKNLDRWRRVNAVSVLLYSCPLCSALTEEPSNHRRWHEREGHWGDKVGQHIWPSREATQ